MPVTSLLSPTLPPQISCQPKIVSCIDPLQDRRWTNLVERHPDGCLFHSTEWLKALSRTYGYKPLAFTTSAAEASFTNGLVFCEVDSWLTGKRLVSLPFSDHCTPLVENDDDLAAFTTILEEESKNGTWRYVEVRPLEPLPMSTALPRLTVPYTFHKLDLSPDMRTLLRNCHKDSTQRKIMRADREGLGYREGTSEEMLDQFYRLLTITRQRHFRPPQPREWFENLIEGFGGALKIRVAMKDNEAVAALLTIRYKDTMFYKYGGSDRRFNHLGTMQMVMWKAIVDAKNSGLQYFDFGRTDAGQDGLITFKRRWGSVQTNLFYSRYGLSDRITHSFEPSKTSWKSKLATRLMTGMPPQILSAFGSMVYRHVG
jgi:CelD/BcsL family acetyltransferase involved in cellulose biosynthesis